MMSEYDLKDLKEVLIKELATLLEEKINITNIDSYYNRHIEEQIILIKGSLITIDLILE